MKKAMLFAPVLGASLFLLSACGGGTPAIALSANWNKDTTKSTLAGDEGNDENVIETLSYDVTFESTEKDGYAVHYDTGSYTTTLKCEFKEIGEGESKYCYYYKTELIIPVWFTVNGQSSEKFTDNVVSEIYFLSREDSLRPVQSIRTSESHTPVANVPKSLEEDYCVHYTDYKLEMNYDTSLTKATINRSYKQRLSSAKEASEVAMKEQVTSVSSVNFFDNSQLLFAIRGFDMLSSYSVKTINPAVLTTQATVNVTAPTAVKQSVKFSMKDGAEEEKQIDDSLDAYETTIGFSGGNGGQAQKLVYATRGDMHNNVYRNMLLYMETPASFSLGTFRYTLKTAVFY